jgi:hypothetical protein
MSRPFSLFFNRGKGKKNRTGEMRGVRGMWKHSNVVFEIDVNSLFKSDVHSSNSKNRHWQVTRGIPPHPAA